ncbi:MAG: autotransporter domain-containing protein [Hyphomonadaceae bacterium]|nr:autotransporter domain-containing protein [Hyphomonadaceae bacterium]
MSSSSNPRSLRAKLLSAAAFATATLAMAPAHALVTPDAPPSSPPGTDPVANAVDTTNTRPYWVGLAIRNEAGNSGGTCTGLLINPRTVLFAAHCVDGLAPSAYDGNSPGNRAQVGYTTDPTFGRTNLREWLFGQDFVVPAGDPRVMDASSVFVWYDPRSRFGSAAVPNNGTFLPADVAIAGFDNATELLGRDAQSGIGLLFTPVAGLVPVTIGGYGQSGNGFTGARTGAVEASYFRRLGQNMLGFLGDERTIALGIYPVATADLLEPGTFVYQDLYWVDFDDPQRATRPFFNGPGTNPNSTLDHDPFPGNAVTGESITAAGDSGSPLVTSAFGREVSLGVLSQGSRFFYESIGNPDDNFVRFTAFSNFGTTAGWNPLFLFWDQIVVNNPYKYVTTVAGNGEWTDPTRWVQELDPLYFTLSGSTLVNALPGTPALGMSSAAPNVGTINPNPSPAATCAFTGTCPPTGGTSDPAPALANLALPGSEGMAYGVSLEDLSPVAANPGYESRIVGATTDAAYGDTLYVRQPANTAGVGEGTLPGTPANEPMTTALWSSGTLIPVNTGTLTGPGTTNFVPNNTLGTAGLQNSTRWFEVNLRASGTTFLTGTTVTIDRLSVRGASSGLNIRSGARLNTTISSFLDAGTLTVNGIFSPSRLTVAGGSLYGTGSILTTAPTGAGLLVNGGLLSPGTGASTVGTLAVTGNTAFTLAGVLGIDVASALSADRLNVIGQLQLGGGAAVNILGGYTPTFGTTWTVANATGGITGSFAVVATNMPGVLRPQFQTVGNNLNMSIIALPFLNATTYTSEEQREIARALDDVRDAPGGYAALSNLFGSLDTTSLSLLPETFEAMTPLNAFGATGIVEATTTQISDALAQRSEQVVNGGGRGFQSAGVEQLGLGPQLASADPYEAMMLGASAIVVAQQAAADTAGRMANTRMRQGWGGFVNISTLVDTTYAITPFAGVADVEAINGTLGFDRTIAGGAGFLGAAISYNTGEATLADPAQTAEADSIGVNLYGGARKGRWHVDGQVGFSTQSYDLERTVPLLLGAQTLRASPDGDTISLSAEVGYDIAAGNGAITPFVGLDGIWANIDGYTESGGSAAMTVDSRSGDVLDARLGVAYRNAFHVGGGEMRPLLSVAYATDLADDDNLVSASFAGFPSVPMSFAGSERDESWVEYEVGIEYEGQRMGVALSYTGADNGQLDYGAVAARGAIVW